MSQEKNLLPTEVTQLVPLLTSQVLKEPLDQMSVVAKATAYAVLSHLIKVCTGRKEKLRLSLLAHIEAHGSATDKGGKEVSVAGHRLVKEKRVASTPNEVELREYLKDKEVALLEVFDEVKTLAVNPSKLTYLVSVGKLDGKKVEGMHEVSWALRVQSSKELNEALSAVE